MSPAGGWTQALGRIVRDVVSAALKPSGQSSNDGRTRPNHRSGRRESTGRRPLPPASSTAEALGRAYPGDYQGMPQIVYAPHPDELPDPGEVVWTWVVFEEDHSHGKDRPVLIIGRDAEWLLGCPLTSKDHHRDERQEASEGRFWVDIGSGDWDVQHRVSEVRVDRIVRVDTHRVRRTAGKLDRARFDLVAAAIRQHRGD